MSILTLSAREAHLKVAQWVCVDVQVPLSAAPSEPPSRAAIPQAPAMHRRPAAHWTFRVHGSPSVLSRRSNPHPLKKSIAVSTSIDIDTDMQVELCAAARFMPAPYAGAEPLATICEGATLRWYRLAMDVRVLIIELWEKIGLVATAALVSVLVPPLRNRLLGLGQTRDRWVALTFGVLLSMWGAKMGFDWLGHHLNLSAIGIMIAAILGGPRIGALAGLFGGIYYVTRVHPDAGAFACAASIIDGAAIGWIARNEIEHFTGWRALPTVAAVQLMSLSVVATGMLQNPNADLAEAWPAMLGQLCGNAAGVALFINVARVILGREQNAVALVEARAAADALSLQELRSRLEPHFLFNALNALRAIIRKDPDQAREMVSNLADLYRYLLHHPEDAPLRSEVAHAQAYLSIEQTRLGPKKLTVSTQIDEDVRELQVPALLLQPLVENAVKHGVVAKRGEGAVGIAARREGDELRIEVWDKAEGEATPMGGGAGIALDTLTKRLTQRYGEAATLKLETMEKGSRAVVVLPIETP